MLALRTRLPERPVNVPLIGVPVVGSPPGTARSGRSASGLMKVSRLLSVPVVTVHGLPERACAIAPIWKPHGS